VETRPKLRQDRWLEAPGMCDATQPIRSTPPSRRASPRVSVLTGCAITNGHFCPSEMAVTPIPSFLTPARAKSFAALGEMGALIWVGRDGGVGPGTTTDYENRSGLVSSGVAV
jgi:hypothetical protein